MSTYHLNETNLLVVVEILESQSQVQVPESTLWGFSQREPPWFNCKIASLSFIHGDVIATPSPWIKVLELVLEGEYDIFFGMLLEGLLGSI